MKNTSPYPLPAVQVVVSFFTADKRFLTSATALVYYTPLLARQTTPFRVTVPHNPAMKTAKLEFQELGGGTIQVTTKGYWILVAQQALQTAGYNPGPLDGKIGSQMRSALRQFQKAKGYKVTGELNKETQEALLNIWITHTQRLMEKLVKELQDLADKQGHTEKKPGADSP